MRTPNAKIAVPAAAGALLVLAGCADPEGDSPAGVSPDEQLYVTVATVLESPEHGPQLCHAVATSLPPQCGGPDIVGWDWDAVAAESAAGTTWGEYLLVGTWDGERFHLAEPARPADEADPDDLPEPPEPSFDTPCPEPAGGWEPVDPATATEAALYEALELAQAAPEYAGSWLDRSYLEEHEDSGDPLAQEEQANDPTQLVLNVRFTADLDDHEQELREVWGGSLCVSGAEYSEAELHEIQLELQEDLPYLSGSGVDTVNNAVTAQVLVASPELQAELDDRYGPGTVILSGLLQPR